MTAPNFDRFKARYFRPFNGDGEIEKLRALIASPAFM